jgi:regulator of RNase E activity RraB
VTAEGPEVEYPTDDDGDALRRLAADGNDMSRPMSIDFTIAVPTQSAGHAIAQAAQELGYRASVEHDDEDDVWTCFCTKHMLATYEGVVLGQQELNTLSRPHGGECDGWGSFGNSAESSDGDA